MPDNFQVLNVPINTFDVKWDPAEVKKWYAFLNKQDNM